MKLALTGLTLVAASFLMLQAGINAKLALFVGVAVRATLVWFALGTAVALVVFRLVPAEPHAPVAQAPWWAWLGGALGGSGRLMTTRVFALSTWQRTIYDPLQEK